MIQILSKLTDLCLFWVDRAAMWVKNVNQWRMYVRSGNKPDYIPNSPVTLYEKKGWVSMSDWLGYYRYMSFEEAREFVHKLNINSQIEWLIYCKTEKLPANMPATPAYVYKDKGWIGIGDWIGKRGEKRATRNREYLQFEQAKEFVHKLKLKDGTEWTNYCLSGKKPDDIPRSPHEVYKDKGWLGMGDWLGTGRIATSKKVFLPFEEAIKYVRKLKLKSGSDWIRYCQSGKKPNDIPVHPGQVYKDKGWVGMIDWLDPSEFV